MPSDEPPLDLPTLFRLKGFVEAGAGDLGIRRGQGHAEGWTRVRSVVAEALSDDGLRNEFDRLFPSTLSTAGRPVGAQGEEAVVLYAQLGGWLGGLIESMTLSERLREEAEAKARWAARH